MTQHYIDEQTLEVFGYKKRAGLIACDVPKLNEEWDVNTHSWVLDEAKVLEQAKAEAEQRIKYGFENALSNGTFLSVTTSKMVDNRRSGSKNDIANIDGQIFKNVYPITWVCADGSTFDLISLTKANELKLEMINDGEAKYINKWTKEQAILSATTVVEYDAIVW